jgi:transposase
MPRQSRSEKLTRRRYSDEFKSEALALAESVGVSEAAAQLQLQSSQLYAWRSRAERVQRRGKVEQELSAENARLKRKLAVKEQEVAILKNLPRGARAPRTCRGRNCRWAILYGEPGAEAVRFLVALTP